MSNIPYGRQDINQEDIDAVVNVLRSDFLTQGPVVPAFEKSVLEYCGAQYAIAVNSATSALHIACLSLGVGLGDIVWTSSITFVASANCALYCGAKIDFVDIDPLTYNLSVERLEEKLRIAKAANNLPKVVIPVHLSGQSCDMERIHLLGQRYGFKIIEDASHAIGGRYKNEPIGSCRYSDITVFSFHPVKIITTAEGGMSTTNDANLAKKMRLFRSHGITNEKSDMSVRPAQEVWNYQQIELGYNYRLTDLHAALGLCQMNRLDSFVKQRHLIAQTYNEEFQHLDVQIPWQHPDTYSAFHLYPVRIKKNKKGLTQREVFEVFHSRGINVNLHYIPVYRQPYFSSMGFKEGYCPEAENYFKETMTLPMYPTLHESDQAKVINVLREILL